MIYGDIYITSHFFVGYFWEAAYISGDKVFRLLNFVGDLSLWFARLFVRLGLVGRQIIFQILVIATISLDYHGFLLQGIRTFLRRLPRL